MHPCGATVFRARRFGRSRIPHEQFPGDYQAWQKRRNLPTRAKSSFSRWATAWWSSAAEAETVTAGGIVLPDTAKDKPARGKIISIGDGRMLDNGVRSLLQVKVGDRVLFSSYAGDTFKLGARELLLMHEEDILAVIG